MRQEGAYCQLTSSTWKGNDPMNFINTIYYPMPEKYNKTILFAILFAMLTVFCAAMLTFTSGYLISSASERPEKILIVYIPIVVVRTFGISRAAYDI